MKKYLGFLLVVILSLQSISAQNAKLLEELQNHFDSIKDFSADLVQLNNGKIKSGRKIIF